MMKLEDFRSEVAEYLGVNKTEGKQKIDGLGEIHFWI